MRFEPLVVMCLVVGTVQAQKPDPALAPIKDDPKLPRVLLIGDSISIGYTLPVRQLLDGKANVQRIPENGGPTTTGLKNLDTWLGEGKWDVIHFNWGLHDLKVIAVQNQPKRHQVPIKEYEQNLKRLVARLKKTGAKLIWASTTPVPEGTLRPPRQQGDERAFNTVAREVMEANGVIINDLHAFAAARLKEIQIPANVHFTKAGSAVLAKQVAEAIETALKK